MKKEQHEDPASVMPGSFVRMATSNRPDEARSTANIYVHGLSVLCPDPTAGSVDIGFYSHGHSPLIICVENPNGVKKTIRMARNAQYQVQIHRDRWHGLGDFYHHPHGRDHDAYDFRWMVSTNRLHPLGTSEVQTAAGRYFSAVVGLRDATFFTRLRSRNGANLRDVYNHKPAESDPVGRLLGAVITCDPNDSQDKGFVVSYRKLHDSTWTTSHFPRLERPYNVFIETIPTDPEDHMPMLYDVLSVNDGNDRSRYSLRLLGETAYGFCSGASEAYVGDRSTEIFYQPEDEQVGLIPPENRREFRTKAEGYLAGYAFRRRSDQYACQPFPNGDGPFDPPWS